MLRSFKEGTPYSTRAPIACSRLRHFRSVPALLDDIFAQNPEETQHCSSTWGLSYSFQHFDRFDRFLCSHLTPSRISEGRGSCFVGGEEEDLPQKPRRDVRKLQRFFSTWSASCRRFCFVLRRGKVSKPYMPNIFLVSSRPHLERFFLKDEICYPYIRIERKSRMSPTTWIRQLLPRYPKFRSTYVACGTD